MYLTQGLHRAVQQFPERTAVIDDGLRRDYRTLADRCARLAGALAEAGLKPGDRWCLCAARWQQALDAGCAPEVVLEATNEAALELIDLEDLEAYAAGS